MSDKYLRIPFANTKDIERINDELSISEQRDAIIKTFNESVNADAPEDPDSIESYDSLREITDAEEAGQIDPATAEQLRIKARRHGLSRF